MTAQGLAHEISKNIPGPDDQQQVEDQKRPAPLLPDLHQQSQGKRDVSEGENGDHGGREGSTQIEASHCDYRKDKRQKRSQKDRRVNCACGGKQISVASGIYRDESEKYRDGGKCRPANGVNAVAG